MTKKQQQKAREIIHATASGRGAEGRRIAALRAQGFTVTFDAFETKPKLLVLNQPANLEPICIDSVNPSNFEGPEMAQQALETGVIADEAAIAAGCNCKYTDEEGTTYFYKI